MHWSCFASKSFYGCSSKRRLKLFNFNHLINSSWLSILLYPVILHEVHSWNFPNGKWRVYLPHSTATCAERWAIALRPKGHVYCSCFEQYETTRYNSPKLLLLAWLEFEQVFSGNNEVLLVVREIRVQKEVGQINVLGLIYALRYIG